LIVATTLGAASLFCAIVRLTESLAISPWEPAIDMEAMRLIAGLPLYEAGHATHMYGPLLTVFLAGIFRLTGLNLLAGRVVFSIFSFILAAVLSLIFCRGQSRKYWLFAFLLFLGVNLRTNLIFFSAQPDCVAALVAVAALSIWILRRESWWGAAFSISLFLCATLLKQTSAAFALIPAAYALIWKRRFVDVAISLIPALSILAMLAAIYLIWPQVFFGMVSVPGSINVNYSRFLPIGLYFIATFPVFLIALLSQFRSREPIGEPERWIWAAIVVLVPVSVWTTCKSGAGYSSLLFGYLAMTALFVVKLDRFGHWIGSRRRSWAFVSASLLALVVLFSFLIQIGRDVTLLLARCGDEKYETAVNYAQQITGRLISPQDPTIAYRAAGYFGLSLFFELDTHSVNGNWPDRLPDALSKELDQAKYVMEVKCYVPTPLFERGLIEHGFVRVPVAALSNSAYALWAKQI
jgi:hypothetical protein